MIYIDCQFCGSDSSKVLIKENGYQGRKCNNCGLVYVSPRPSIEEIFDLYGHNEAKVSAESHITSAFPKRLYARHHLKLIQRYVKSGKLLEIGAGAGYFLDEAKKRGFGSHGIEFNPIQANYIRDCLSIDCEETALGQSSYMDKQFDLLYHCDVVSHFYSPVEEFNLMNRVIKRGGYIVFETGNIGDMDPDYLQYIERFQYPDHLFFFGVKNIEYLLEKTGFELVDLHRFSLMPQLKFARTISMLKQRIMGKNAHSEKENESNKGNAVIISAEENVPRRGSMRALKAFRINLMEYLYFLLRYKLGKVLVRSGQPQTLIIVARKVSDVPDKTSE